MRGAHYLAHAVYLTGFCAHFAARREWAGAAIFGFAATHAVTQTVKRLSSPEPSILDRLATGYVPGAAVALIAGAIFTRADMLLAVSLAAAAHAVLAFLTVLSRFVWEKL